MNKKIGKALVVGAGISGIRSALDLAEAGYGVTLIDRAPNIGGILTRLDHQFPTDHCGMCKMLPMVNRDASSQFCLRKGLFHENIDIKLSTDLVALEGEPGHYKVTLKHRANLVNPDLCMGGGDCAGVCPVEVPDEFNGKLTTRKAVYLPVPHSIPNTYTIDLDACNRCGKCVEVCPTGAIDLLVEARKKFRILVVDDELIVRDSLSEWLMEEGFSVDMAGAGPEALDLLKESEYQLMLLDIKMPGMDGVEVLKRAKDIRPDMTVVMMTAYATVETAVEAMKTGALDYLIKPFDPDVLTPKIVGIYQNVQAAEAIEMDVGAVVLCCGTDYFEPSAGKNPFGYGSYPDVVTSLEFERMISGTGPTRGRLESPVTGKPIRKITWIQCVGSRDLQSEADFCSNICCMYAIKEAILAKRKAARFGGDIETVIFYMDMRTFGKSYQRYRDEAENVHGVRFERGRIHSVNYDPADKELSFRYVNIAGEIFAEKTDMIVLAVGQRPPEKTQEMAENLGLPLTPYGFIRTTPFYETETERKGICVGGSFTGLKDISDSVLYANAAALSASSVIHSAGGSVVPDAASTEGPAIPTWDFPKILVAVCSHCKELPNLADKDDLTAYFNADPAVAAVVFPDQCCTASGWNAIKELVNTRKPNRILIGACMPYVYIPKFKALSREVGIDASCMDVVDIRTPTLSPADDQNPLSRQSANSMIKSLLDMGIVKLKRIEPSPVHEAEIFQNALVIGGGIAGMTAALSIAHHGYEVDLVETGESLGGNLLWLSETLEGDEIGPLFDDTVSKVEKHPHITVHKKSQVIGAYGEVGRFFTTIADGDGNPKHIRHGVTIVATGGKEASTTSYRYGENEKIVTQKELEQRLSDGTIDPGEIHSVVMIQCVDSREEPRNYCSRICCASSIKHALNFKAAHPDMNIFILYRDIMTYGFSEAYYTRARKANVNFIQYRKDAKPEVDITPDGTVWVKVFEPIIGRDVRIESDIVVLATGISPNLPDNLISAYGIAKDADGFFQEAELKWRPVDSLKEGVFACGLTHSPRTVKETIVTAQAAAQRALRILFRQKMPAGKIVAEVKHAICSLCERCIEYCPYGARAVDPELERITINPLMCQGCGACAAICPNDASYLEGFTSEQMLEMIDAAIG